MARNPEIASIINFWRAVEMFSPQSIPRLAPNDNTAPVFLGSENSPLPWEASQGREAYRNPPHTSTRYLVYCGIYELKKVRSILEDKLGSDPDTFDELPDGEACMFAFSVTDDGRPLFDTFVLLTCAWATSRTLTPGPGSVEWLVGFDNDAELIAVEFAQGCSVHLNDEGGQMLLREGYNLGRQLNYADIYRETMLIVQKLGISDLFEVVQVRIKRGYVATRNKYSSDDQDFLNSFFQVMARFMTLWKLTWTPCPLSSFL